MSTDDNTQQETGLEVDDFSGTETTGHTWDEDLVELNAPLPSWWLYLFHITIVFSIIYIVLYPGLGNALVGTGGRYGGPVRACRG